MFCCDLDEEKDESAIPVPKPRRKFVMTESSFRHMVEIIGRSDKYTLKSTLLHDSSVSYQFADLDQIHVKSTSLTLDSVKLPIVGCVGHHVDGEPSAPRCPFLLARKCLSIVANICVYC